MIPSNIISIQRNSSNFFYDDNIRKVQKIHLCSCFTKPFIQRIWPWRIIYYKVEKIQVT
jgi:hypothetical protein